MLNSTFCLWAPWVFSALAGLAGWLLRRWYDDQRRDDLNALIQTKEADIYHLNEAHQLLLNDKDKRLSEHAGAAEIKDRTILELRRTLEQSEETNKSLLSKVVQSKTKEALPLAVSPAPSATVVHKKEEISTKIKSDIPRVKRSKRMRLKKYKRKLNKARKIINQLKTDNRKLLLRVQKEGTSEKKEVKLKEVLPQKIIKEIPITITRTILVKEKIDRKKLKKLIRKLPLIKSKKVIKEKRKKGKVRIVSKK